jgi:SAM-dependent methyltransferase
LKPEEKKKLVGLYESRYDQYGYDVSSIGWGDVESQQLRFQILADIADLSDNSICDLGCGFGDLYPYLMKRYKRVDYCGIDLSPKLIHEAQKRHPGVNFEVRDILSELPERKFDYVLSSGALSFKIRNHENYVRKMIGAIFSIALKGIAVNLLSSYVDYKLKKNFHLPPEKAFKMGRELTPYVTIRHDYPLYEFTLYLYHSTPCCDKGGTSAN